MSNKYWEDRREGFAKFYILTMARSIKQLRSDFEIINLKIKDLARELQSLYKDYFPQLVTVVKRQLILATYHICTQKYPSAFLSLTYQQKVNLQKNIKALIPLFVNDLSKNITNLEIDESDILSELKGAILRFLPVFNNNNSSTNTGLTSESKEDNKNSQDNSGIVKEDNNSFPDDDSFLEIYPENLIRLQVGIDDAIEEALVNLSHGANKYLLEFGILPKNVPTKILEMALQAEENTSLVSGAPNLLSLLIEKDDKSQEMNVTPVVALCLRVNEIEFHDPLLNQIRQKISKIFQSLNSLDDEYQNKRQQYQMALAESAWRSSWIDD